MAGRGRVTEADTLALFQHSISLAKYTTEADSVQLRTFGVVLVVFNAIKSVSKGSQSDITNTKF